MAVEELKYTHVYLSPCTRLNTWIKDLNIRQDTLISIEKRVGNRLELIGAEKGFS